MLWIEKIATELSRGGFRNTSKVADKFGFGGKDALYRAIKKETGLSFSEWKRSVTMGQAAPSEESESVLAKECLAHGAEVDDVAYYWLKTNKVSAFIRRPGEMSYSQARDAIIAEMGRHAPKYRKIKHEPGEHLLILNPADLHFGKRSHPDETGYSYGVGKTAQMMEEGVSALLAKAAPFGVKQIVFVIGNDVLHVDGVNMTTTGGTRQDSDGSWWEMFLAAKRSLVTSIETLANHAPVSVVFVPSNHDYVSGFMLADSISSWFRNHPHVSFGEDSRNVTINPRKYILFGSNLIGFTHGHGAKEKDLGSLMQFEAREAWSMSRYAYWYTAHFHHNRRQALGMNPRQLSKDLTGVMLIHTETRQADPKMRVYVETLRSPSPPDAWHHQNGYINEQAMEAFLHHPDQGQVARITHFFQS